MQYRVIVIDDEQPICDEIEYLLSSNLDVVVVAKFVNSLDALNYLKTHTPDIVFLDIKMPGLSGIELAQKLGKLPVPPLIVFTTAYQEHALEAFETPAIGYITKPVTEEKLETVLHKIRSLTGRKQAPAAGANAKKFCVTKQGKILPLDIKEIVLVYVDDKNIYVRTCNEEFTCSLTLKEIEELLPESGFMRVHRKYIVNLDSIAEIIPWFHGSYLLKMRDFKQQEVPVSRTKAKSLKLAVGLK